MGLDSCPGVDEPHPVVIFSAIKAMVVTLQAHHSGLGPPVQCRKYLAFKTNPSRKVEEEEVSLTIWFSHLTCTFLLMQSPK